MVEESNVTTPNPGQRRPTGTRLLAPWPVRETRSGLSGFDKSARSLRSTSLENLGRLTRSPTGLPRRPRNHGTTHGRPSSDDPCTGALAGFGGAMPGLG